MSRQGTALERDEPVSADAPRLPEGTQVSVVIGGRFHAFDLARELHARGLLRRLVTSYPKSRTRSFLPDDKVAGLPLIFVQRGLERLSPRLAGLSYNYLNAAFAKSAPRYVEGSTI